MNPHRCQAPRIGTSAFFPHRVLVLVALALSCAASVRAQATFGGTQFALNSGTLAAPAGVTSDGSGDIFIADKGNNRVLELSPSGSGYEAPATILTGLSGPAGVAADWNGNVYVADTGNGRIVMLPLSKSGFGSPVTVATGLNTPSGVAVDSADNLYVAVSGSNCVMEIPFAAGAYGMPFVVETGFINPLAVTVDSERNLYVADSGNRRVVKELFTASGYTTQTYYWDNVLTPISIYIDKAYNLYVVDGATGRVIEAPWEAGANRYNGNVVLGSGFASPTGVVTDTSGNVYVADSTNDQVVKLTAASVPFGAVSVGSSAQPLTYNFNIAAGTTLGSISIVSQGVSGRDFVDSGQSTCALQTYSSATVCGVSVLFQPLASGTRSGAVVLSGSSGNPLASVFTSGVGEEAQVAFLPGATTTLGSQLSGPEGAAVDGNGNVFIADTGNNRVVEIPWTGSGYGQQTTVPVAGLNSPTSVAADGAGNLYIASNGSGKVVRLAWSGTGYGPQSNVGTGLYTPFGVTADALGNVYITDMLNQRVDKVPWTGSDFAAEEALGDYAKSPTGIAVGGNGNVFFSGPYVSNVSEVPWNGSAYNGQVDVAELATPFPVGLAVDANSNLYSVDAVLNEVFMLPWSGTGFGTRITVATGFNAPHGITVDSNGNLYVVDTGNNQVVKIELSAPAMQSFDTTYLGSTSKDSAHLGRVENIGNLPLVLDSVTYPPDFPESAGAASPCNDGTSLGPGQMCQLAMDFTPVSVGSPLSESIAVTVNSPGVAGTQYSLPLSGIGVAKAAQTITLPPIASLTYGIARLVLAATASSGLPVTYSVISGPGLIMEGDVLVVNGAGTIVMQAAQAGNSAFQPAPTIQISIRVNPAVLTVTPLNATCVYRSVPTTFQYSITGLVQGDNPGLVMSGRPAVTSTVSSNSDAGTYPITASLGTLVAANYTFVFATGTLTVNKAPIRVQAVSLSRSYGSPMQPLKWTLSGFLDGDSATVVTGAPVLTTIVNSGSPVGVYPIAVSVATLSAADYSFSAVNGSITVNPASLTIAPVKASLIYGTSIPALSYTISGFMNGDTPSSSVEGTPVLTTTANSLSAAGSYVIQLSRGTLTAANYSFSFATGVLTINKATIVVAADNVSSTYGSNIPLLPYSMIGFVNGDTAATAIQGSPSMNVAANAKSAPGTYLIVPSLGSMVSKNYTFVFVNGVLTIGKAQLTVTPTALSMTYGGQLPALTYSYSGFVNGDGTAALTGAPKISTTAKSGSPAGAYPISVLAGTLASNRYSFQFVPSTLTVAKAPLIVKANSLTASVASALPGLTYSVSGLVNKDTLASATTGAPALATTANITKAGTYGITITAGTMAASNYQLTFENGTMTVRPPPALYRVANSMVSSDSE